MKIEDFDTTKPKIRKRLRSEKRSCEMEISNFPRSSNIDDILFSCELLHSGQEITHEIIGKNSYQSVYPILQTMRTIGLTDEENNSKDIVKKIANYNKKELKLRELAMLVSRSNWMRRWVEWTGNTSIFDMRNHTAIDFLRDVSYGEDSTLKSTSSNMNSLLTFAQDFHPSRDSTTSPDTKPWQELKRQQFERESIFESGKMASTITRVSHLAEFVRIASGYLSILGYDIVASNLNGAEMRLLIGSNDNIGRMEISNAINDLKKDLESGPDSPIKHEAARSMRRAIIGGGLRVRCLKARHTPDFHPKVQIYDKSAVLSGSFNMSYNGLVKNVENCEVVVDEDSIRYYIENFDDFFNEAIPIEDEILEMLDDTWALSSDELINPRIAWLRVLLEIYGDSSDQEAIDGIGLADYQEYSVNKSIRDLSEFGGSLLVAPTGTGKTLMGSIVATRLIQMKKINRVFVIAPNQQILSNWEELCMRLRIPFQGYTYAKFQRSDTKKSQEQLSNLKNSLRHDDLVIADECHHIRNIGGKGSDRIMDIIDKPSKKSPMRLFLTATPMSKLLGEINNLLEFTHGAAKVTKPIDVSKAPSITYLTHNLISQKFAKESPTGHRFVTFSGDERYFAIKKTEQARYESLLLDQVLDILVEIPLNVRKRLPVGQETLSGGDRESPGKSEELYRVCLSRMIESSPAMGIRFVEYLLEKDLDSIFFHSDSLRDKLEKMKLILKDILDNDKKLEALVEYIKDDVEKGDPILIFAEYKETVRYLKERLEERFGVVIESLTSEDGTAHRIETCTRFSPLYNGLKTRKTDPKILIATDCLSEGVDLPDAKLMVNYDLFWTPLKMVQRVGRLDRPTSTKRSFRAANMVPSTNVYDSLFQLQSRLDDRSGIYREMSGIEVYRDHIRDLDNPSEDELNAVRSMHGEHADHAFEQYVEQFATEILSQLAKATEEEKKEAMNLRTGATSNCSSTNCIGILSVIRDADGYPHLLSEHYDEEWGEGKIEPQNQEESIQNGMPPFGAVAIPISASYYPRHELMLSKLSAKYNCEIEQLSPIVNVIKS